MSSKNAGALRYAITDHTREKAKKAGLTIKLSKRKYKKLDVYKDGKYLASIGDTRYKDYGTYLKEEGKSVAEERRRLYHLRHTQNTLGERLALLLLW